MNEEGLSEIQINLLREAPISPRYLESPVLGALMDLIIKGFIRKVTGREYPPRLFTSSIRSTSSQSSAMPYAHPSSAPNDTKYVISGETRYELTDKGYAIVVLLGDK